MQVGLCAGVEEQTRRPIGRTRLVALLSRERRADGERLLRVERPAVPIASVRLELLGDDRLPFGRSVFTRTLGAAMYRKVL